MYDISQQTNTNQWPESVISTNSFDCLYPSDEVVVSVPNKSTKRLTFSSLRRLKKETPLAAPRSCKVHCTL